MKNKKSNRGFSFVELLAAIVIMGLLSGLAIVSIRFLTNKAEKEYYKAQENEIVMAAKSYTQDNRNYLPKRVGFKNQIYLKTLQDKKYIGDVVDRGKKKCDPTKSYVQVYRYDKNHYNYVVNLVCNSYKSMDNDDSNITEKPTVKINFLNVSKNDKYSDAKVNLVIEDDNKISSYSYIIIKDGEEVKNSGDIDGKLQTKINTNISLADYVPGKITVKVVATNTFGNQGKASETVTVKNENAPECQIVSDNSAKDVNGNPTCEGKWINNPDSAIVEAQVKCIDKSGSGCQKDVYTQKFFGERKTDAILIKDNTGNSYNCPVHVCIDVTKPTTPVIKNDYENVWTNKPYSIEITSYDETAGIAYFEYRYPNSTGRDGNGVSEREWHKWENSSKSPGDKTPFVTTKFSKERAEYVEVRACDRAGNCSDTAKSMIKIDKTAPTCTITKTKAKPDGLNDWYVTDVNLTLNRNDVNGSGDRAVNSPISYELKNTNSASYKGTTMGTQKDTKGITWYGFIKDEAGNKTSCNSGSFKVDTTKPDKPTITNNYENKWINKAYTISIVSVDQTSGIDYFAYRYPTSTSAGENTWRKYENSSRVPGVNTAFTTTKFSKERDENVEIEVCDVAGNCSDTSSSRIRIDKTAPTCTITRNKANPDGLNDWYVTNVNLTLNRNDVNGSGDRAVKSPISYELKNTNSASYNGTTTGTQKDTKGITWYGFIKDEAGNKTSCNSGSFKVDTTKPDKPTIKNDYNNKWINKSYTISIVSVDKTAGIDYIAYRYPTSTSAGENVWDKYENSSRSPGVNTEFVTPAFSKERNENVEIKVCDVAGNCSDVSTNTIKIDKTAPTCTVTKNIAQPNGNNNWYKSNVVLTLNRKDPVGSSDRAVASPISYGLKNSNSTSYNGTSTATQTDISSVTWYGFIKDEAGNATKCNSGSFKVDATKPTMNFSISGETAVVKCSDAMSGLATTAQKKQDLTGTRNVTVSFSCTDNAGNTIDSSHTYRYNSCKYTKNTCSYGCDSCYNSCLTTKNTCKSKTTCDDCGKGSPVTCVPGNVTTTCSESRLCTGKSRSSCNNTSGCTWHGGSTAHGDCGGRYTYTYSCTKYSYCASTKNTCEKVCTTDSCATGSPRTCVGGYEDCNCSSCYYGSPNTCNGGGFELN